MKKVYIKGKIKTIKDKKITIKSFDSEGWLKDNKVFYPDKDNLREFYKITNCEKCWDSGILYSELKEIENTKEKKEKKRKRRKKAEKENEQNEQEE